MNPQLASFYIYDECFRFQVWFVMTALTLISILTEGDIDLSREMLYKTIWVILLAHILLYFFQELSFTVGTVAENDLGNLIRLNYSRGISYFLWISSELAIISADVQEVLGATIALKILFHLNMYVGKNIYV